MSESMSDTKREPLVSDEEIQLEWDSAWADVEKQTKDYFAIRQGEVRPVFARRIEALVRKRLADRLRAHDFFQTEMPWKKLSVQEQAARIVEED